MNKQVFFKKLRKALRWTFAKNEMLEIISDYEDFFVSGHMQGKTEGQICVELGDPDAIAFNLADELHKKRPLSAKVIERIVLSIILLGIGFAYYYAMYQSEHIIRESMIGMMTFSAVLWFLLGGTMHKLPPVSHNANKLNLWIFSTGHAILTLIIMISIFVFQNMLHTLLREAASAVEIASLGSTVGVIRSLFAVITLFIAVYAVYGFYRSAPQYFTLIIHAIGVMAYVSAAYHVLRNMNDFIGLRVSIIALLAIYGVTIAWMALFALVIRVFSRRAT